MNLWKQQEYKQKVKKEQEGIYSILKYITMTPRLKIWQQSRCIYIMKGVL